MIGSHVTPELKQTLRNEAIRRDTSLSMLVYELLEDAVTAHSIPRAVRKDPNQPPISFDDVV